MKGQNRDAGRGNLLFTDHTSVRPAIKKLAQRYTVVVPVHKASRHTEGTDQVTLIVATRWRSPLSQRMPTVLILQEDG